MLKPRIIALLPVLDGYVVQSIGFSRHLPVGRPEIAVEFLDRWGIDEIILVDIRATIQGRTLDADLVRRCARVCHVPLAVGGGIRTLDHMEQLIHAGADKIALNTQALVRPALLREGAERFGSQCMVASIDGRHIEKDVWTVHGSGSVASGILAPWQAARMAQENGAGEILLQSVDRDGLCQGYDLELAKKVRDAVSIPVILAGGAGHPRHFLEGIRLGLSAVAAGNMFHYTEMSVIQIKRYLLNAEILVRLDTYATLEGAAFDADGRLDKRQDTYLDQLRFQFIPDELI